MSCFTCYALASWVSNKYVKTFRGKKRKKEIVQTLEEVGYSCEGRVVVIQSQVRNGWREPDAGRSEEHTLLWVPRENESLPAQTRMLWDGNEVCKANMSQGSMAEECLCTQVTLERLVCWWTRDTGSSWEVHSSQLSPNLSVSLKANQFRVFKAETSESLTQYASLSCFPMFVLCEM